MLCLEVFLLFSIRNFYNFELPCRKATPQQAFNDQSFKVSKFQNLKVPKFQFSKLQSLNASSSKFQTKFLFFNVWDAPPQTFNNFQILNSPKSYFGKCFWICSSIILSVLVSPNMKVNGFGAHGYVRKSWNHRNLDFDGSLSYKHIEKLQVQIEAE